MPWPGSSLKRFVQADIPASYMLPRHCEVHYVRFWMQKFNSKSPKRTVCYSNLSSIVQLDLGRLSKQERLAKSTISTTRGSLNCGQARCTCMCPYLFCVLLLQFRPLQGWQGGLQIYCNRHAKGHTETKLQPEQIIDRTFVPFRSCPGLTPAPSRPKSWRCMRARSSLPTCATRRPWTRASQTKNYLRACQAIIGWKQICCRLSFTFIMEPTRGPRKGEYVSRKHVAKEVCRVLFPQDS